MAVKRCVCLEDVDWRTVYAVLVNEHELLHDLAESQSVYEQDVVTIGRIIDELSDQCLSLV